MNLRVRVKQLGSRRDKIREILFPVENNPTTVRELIGECVTTSVNAFNDRIKNNGGFNAFEDSFNHNELEKFTRNRE